MKICLFSRSLPVHITGGMERHTYDLVRGLVKRGHNVVVITTKHPDSQPYEKKGKVEFYYVGDKPAKYTKIFYRESAKIFKILDNVKNFDIVHSQSSAAMGYIKYCNKNRPLIITDHGTILNSIKSLILSRNLASIVAGGYIFIKDYIINYHLFNNKILLKKADKIISVSRELKIDIIKQYDISEDKLTVIPNGIDINKFKPTNVDALKEKLNLSEKIILSVGRIEKQKGYHLLLKILPDLLKNHDVKLVIVGTGSYLQTLKKMAVKLGIRDKVVFTGRVPDEDLPKYYNLADVFAFPTLRMEGLPLVIPEAMACEKPVIASRIGGIPTVIEDWKDGFLIQPNDLKDLKNKILMLLEDENLAKKIGKTARRKVVRRFSVDRMVDDTIKVYEGVLSNGR